MKLQQFLAIIARNLVPLYGVFMLGWSAPNLAILYSVDSALALAAVVVLAAAYLTAQENGKGVQVLKGPAAWISAMAGVFLLAAIFAVPFCIPAYIFVAGAGWSLMDALGDASFVRGLWLQAAISATGFAETYFAMFRYDNVQSVLRARTGFTIGRWVITMAVSATLLSFLAAWLDAANAAQVVGVLILLVYMGITLYSELFPGRVQDLLEQMAPREGKGAGRKAKQATSQRQKKKPG